MAKSLKKKAKRIRKTIPVNIPYTLSITIGSQAHMLLDDLARFNHTTKTEQATLLLTWALKHKPYIEELAERLTSVCYGLRNE